MADIWHLIGDFLSFITIASCLMYVIVIFLCSWWAHHKLYLFLDQKCLKYWQSTSRKMHREFQWRVSQLRRSLTLFRRFTTSLTATKSLITLNTSFYSSKITCSSPWCCIIRNKLIESHWARPLFMWQLFYFSRRSSCQRAFWPSWLWDSS
jgi:hypothetical protein